MNDAVLGYRLDPKDETGVAFERSLGQLALAAVGILLASGLAIVSNIVVGIAAGAPLVAVGLVHIEGQPVLGLLRLGLDGLRHRLRRTSPWYSVEPLLSNDGTPATGVLADHDLLVVDAATLGVEDAGKGLIALSRDLVSGTLAATIRIRGREFQLLDQGEQDWMITQWGSALQGFVQGQQRVQSVRWAEWCGPDSLDDHRRWVDEHMAPDADSTLLASYRTLLDESQPPRHEVLVTLTVAMEAAPRRKDVPKEIAAVEMLLEEISLLRRRLAASGLQVSGVLGPRDWGRSIRLRLDPGSGRSLDRCDMTLAATPGVDPSNAAPLAEQASWKYWCTDDTYHRAFKVAEWPRSELGPTWLGRLINWTEEIRSVVVIFEPIPAHESMRAVKRTGMKVDSDANARTSGGQWVGSRHRRARSVVEQRDEELDRGYGECAYSGIVVVSSTSEHEVETAGERAKETASTVGITLRPLNGRHHEATCATLPLARSVAPRRRGNR